MNLDILPILISLLSCVIALLSVFYARKSRDIAKQANQIALHNDLKPSRLAIYNTLRDFADYFCGYYTLQWCVKAVKGTHDLSNRIVAVKWELDSYGPLGMADVEEKAAHLQKKAWQLQRVLDRLGGNDLRPLDKQYENIEDNLHGIIDWFAKEKADLRKLFEKYLKIT